MRIYAVWVPKAGGREHHVPAATRYIPDPRTTHYWDGSSVLVNSYNPVLSLGQDAWDIYLVYGPDARWDEAAPPKPAYWMHQLNFNGAPELDPALLLEKVNSLSGR